MLTPRVKRCLALALAAAIFCALGGANARGQTAGTARFPLRVEPGKRYLIDAESKPFFIIGDSPWTLAANINNLDLALYLDDRARRGFNALLFSAMERCYTLDWSGADGTCGSVRNFRGDPPFEKNDGGLYQFAKPVEAYWRNVDRVVAEASKRNFLLLIAPAFVGVGAGSDGWWHDMIAAGTAGMEQWGRFIATRYKANDNILWINGGDYSTPDWDYIDAVARGIESVKPNSLFTYHGGRGSAAIDLAADRRWLRVNAIYTDELVAKFARSSYAKSTMPFFLLEAMYEDDWASGYGVRKQAWQASLGGATGQLLGIKTVWRFASGWKKDLDSGGTRSISALGRIFSSLSWWLLIPDIDFSFEVAIDGRRPDTAALATISPAALASDGSFGLVYNSDCMPGRKNRAGPCLASEFKGPSRSLSVAISKLRGSHVEATWIDPFTGGRSRAGRLRTRTSGVTDFRTPGRNAAGDTDWLLLLRSVR